MSPTQPQTHNPPSIPHPPPTYSQLAITPLTPSSKLITLAGQTGLSTTNGTLAPDIDSQSRQAYVNISNALAAAGATPRDIVHVRHYIVEKGGEETELVDRGWGDEWMEFMDREAEGYRPPDTVLGVAGLAKRGILYECEVWAVVH